MPDQLTNPVSIDRVWLKDVTHAARIAELAGHPEIDLSRVRPAQTAVERAWIDGLAAQHELRRLRASRTVGDPLTTRLLAAIDDHACRSDCTIATVAQAVGTSEATARRRCKATTGLTLMEYLHRARVNCARRLLLETTMSVKEVAAAVGYRRTSALDRQFRRLFGQRPSDLRRNCA